MKRLLLSISVSACIITAGVAVAQKPSNGSPASQQQGNIEYAAQSFVAEKRANQSRVQGLLDRRGRGNGVGPLKRLLNDLDFARPNTPGISAETQAAINDSLLTDAAQYLAASNFAPNKVNAYLRAGFNPLEAAIAIVRGTPSPANVAILADRVIVGRVLSVEASGSPAERTSIVTLDVDDTVLGPASDSVVFEQGGGLDAPLRSTILPNQDSRVLVFLTDPAGNTRGDRETLPTNLVTPFVETNGRFVPLGSSTIAAFSLDTLRAEIRPLTQLRVNNRGN